MPRHRRRAAGKDDAALQARDHRVERFDDTFVLDELADVHRPFGDLAELLVDGERGGLDRGVDGAPDASGDARDQPDGQHRENDAAQPTAGAHARTLAREARDLVAQLVADRGLDGA